MKKRGAITLIIGIALLAFSVGVMLYGVNNNQSFYKIGSLIFWIGLIVIIGGFILVALKRQDKK
ncbi:hypothetical protein [Salegentibacter mishustinae]|uniref:hypothetical protein n=1 Tax=Salegentibacter mishustinae TaxID=270918 RepID=UPI00248F9E81|nr:hypothetical protein [Salegentibacter mishustinae]